MLMKMPKLATLSFFFLATVLLQPASVVGQTSYYLWKNGNPSNEWKTGTNWEQRDDNLVQSNSSPGYGLGLPNNFTLIIAGGTEPNQRANYNPLAGDALTTTFGGDLSIGARVTVPAPSGVTQDRPGYLQVSNGSLIIAGSAFLSNTNTAAGGGAGTSTLEITGGELRINGASFNLNNNTEVGNPSVLNLNGGVLQVNQFTKTGAGAVTVNFGNGTLRAGAAANANFFNVLANTTVNLIGNTSIDTAGQGIAIAQVLNGAGGFTKIGSGTLTLSGTNLFTGKTAVHNGTVAISSEANLGVTPGAFVPDQLTLGTAGTQGTLQANATFGISTNRGVTLSGAGGMIDVANGQTLTVNSVITGGATLQKSGSSGTLVLTNNNTYTGTTTVTAGTLRLRDATANINAAGNVAVGDSATFELLNTGSRSYSGNFTNVTPGGTGKLVSNIGAGSTLTLTGAASTANVEVLSGTTLVNGTFTNQTTTVFAGATLGGSGRVGNMVVNGTLTPGTSIESLGAGNVTFNNGSIFNYELDSSAAPGARGDLLHATGALTISGIVTLNLQSAGVFAVNEKLTLISYNNATPWNGGLFSLSGGGILADDSIFTQGSNTWRIDYNDIAGGTNFVADQILAPGVAATGFVTITAVPEPSSIFLVGIAASFALIRRRRSAV